MQAHPILTQRDYLSMAALGTARYESRLVAELPLSMRGRQIWHRSAPPRLLSAGAWDSDSKGWRIWREHLAKRKRKHPDALWETKTPDWLRWTALGAWDEHSRLPLKPLKKLGRSGKLKLGTEEIANLFAILETWGSETQGPLECLRLAYLLPQLAQGLEANVWWDLLDRLVQLTADADALSAEEMAAAHQLLAGELRLTLAYLFPELKPCRRLAEKGAAVISRGIVELSSDEGALHATQLADLRPLLACWTRSLVIGSRLKRGALSSAARARYASCTQQVSRLLTCAGDQLLADETDRRWPRSLLNVAQRIGKDLADRRITAHHEEENGADNQAPKPSEPSAQSDAAEYAILRSSWKRTANLLGVDYSGGEVVLDLNVGGEFLWRGSWRLELVFDEARLELLDSWESVCWVSDKDVAYLELQGSFSEGVKVQRQLLLAKREDFLFLNDVVLPGKAGQIRYRATLPCLEHVVFQPAAEHRELKVLGHTRQMLALPIALAEWSSARCDGEFSVKGQQLEYRRDHAGQGLAVPLWIDLRQKSREVPFTWRPLTVAENRQIVAPDAAVAHRVQVGDRRYVFYRSLATQGTRTVLGAHLASEFLASRMADDGELKTLIEIE